MSYRSEVTADSPSGWWHLDETSGTVADDAISTNDGTIVNAPGLGATALVSDGVFAVSFPGNVLHTEVTLPGPSLSTNGSIELWFKWSSGTALMRDNTSSGGWIIGFDSSGTFAVRVAGTTITTSKTTAQVRDGNTHHLVVTKSGATVTVYLDGVSIGSSSAVANTASATPWHVGRNGSATANADYPTATIDEVAIYPTALSSTRVGVHYTAGVPASPQTVSPSSIGSAEAFGTPTIGRGAVTVSPSSIGSAEAFGTPTVTGASPQTVSPSSIGSAEAFGTPTVTGAAVSEPQPLRGLDWHITGLWDNPATTISYYGRIADPIDGEVAIPLNDSRTASVTVSIFDPIIANVDGHTYERLLKVYYRGLLVFWGPIKLVEINLAEGTARLSAVDPSLRLIHHFLRRGDLDGDLNAAHQDRGTVSIDANGIRLLRDAGINTASQTSRGVPDLGIIDGTNDFTDAPDNILGVARGDQVWEAMQQLAANLGPDFELQPIEDTAGAYCQLNTFERQGADNGVRFEYGTGKDNLDNLAWSEGSKYITHVHVLDKQPRYRFTPANLDTSADTGPYVDWVVTEFDAHNVDAADAEAVLVAYGQDLLKAYSVPLVVTTLTLPIEEEADYHYLDDFVVGDSVSVSGRTGHIDLAEYTQRITCVTLKQEGPENATRTELQVIPSPSTSPDSEDG